MGARYTLLPLFVIALLFIVASPVSWLLTHVHQKDDVTAIDYENAVLYQKIYPFHRYAAAALSEGVLPLWNPQLHSGTPFLADFSNGVFQPLHALFLFVPTARALAVHAFVAISLSGVFFVFFGRALGLSYTASLIGGVAFAYCGASLAASTRPALATTLAWTPLAFWALREFANSGLRTHAVVAGVAVAMIILGGGWALAVVMFVFLGMYAAVLFYRSDQDPALPRFSAAVVIVAVALGLSAIQWAPSLPWLLSRAHPWMVFWNTDIAVQSPSDFPSLLRQLFAAQAGTLPRLLYIGVPVLLLIPAGLFHQGPRRDVWFFAIAVPVSLALLLLFSGARSPGLDGRMLAYPALFSMSVLAAMGVHRLLAGRRANPVWWVGLVTVLTALTLFVVTEPLVRSTIVVFVVLLAPALALRFRLVTHIAGFSIAFLLFFDLTSASANKFAHPLRDAPQCYMTFDGFLARAEELAVGARTLVATHPLNKAVPENIGMIYPLLSAGGAYVPLTPDQERWQRALIEAEGLPAGSSRANRQLLDVMAARVVITDVENPFDPTELVGADGTIEEAHADSGLRLYLNNQARPRCYFVADALHVDGIEGALAVINDVLFDPAQTATVDLTGGGIESLAPVERETPEAGPAPVSVTVEANTRPMRPSTTGGDVRTPAIASLPGLDSCVIESGSPNELVLRVNASRPGITVVADTYAAGWSATLDAAPTSILRVNGLFRGIATPAGYHTIIFTYRPAAFYAGAAVSLLTLAAMAIAGLRMLHKPR